MIMETCYIKEDEQLDAVLALCYSILGEHLREVDNYKYADWKDRVSKYSRLLIYAKEDNVVIAAVLGRPENADSLVLGFAACHEGFRLRGITSKLIQRIEINAKEMGFKYITLGANSKAEAFYEKCGYRIINEIHGQKIFQKIL